MRDMITVDIPEGRSGDWRVEHFEIPTGPDIQSMRCARDGRPVIPGIFTRLMRDRDWAPVMSDTPAEVEDHLPFIYQARGRVLINGLGLGVVLKGLLQEGKVEHIDVVELEQDVINLVWPTYQDDPRLAIHHADAYTIEWPKGTRWDYIWHDIWHDIWPTICADNLEGIARLKRKYARMCGWQGAWLEDRLRYLKHRGY